MAVEELRGDSLKQRLVGGIALLLIGVIAWFWLLSADSPVDPVSRATQIPAVPDIQSFDVPEPTASAPTINRSDSLAQSAQTTPADAPIAKSVEAKSIETRPVEAKSAEAKPVESQAVDNKSVAAKPVINRPVANQPAAKTVAAKSKETFELDPQGLPVAWVVQVGLFSSQASADKVKASLQEKGFKAYSEAFKTAAAPNGFKVFVGPKLSRERADEQKRAIDSALKVDSKVVRFQSPPR